MLTLSVSWTLCVREGRGFTSLEHPVIYYDYMEKICTQADYVARVGYRKRRKGKGIEIFPDES